MVTHEIVTPSESLVIVIVRVNPQLVETMKQNVEPFMQMGAGQIIDNQVNSIAFQARSLHTFNEVEDQMAKGQPFATAFLRSLKLELDVNLHKELFGIVFEIAGAMIPNLEQSPFALAKVFNGLNLEFKFASTDSLPDDIKKHFNPHFLKNGLALKLHTHHHHHGHAHGTGEPKPENVHPFFSHLVELVEPGVEAHFVAAEYAAISLDTKLPGFEKHFHRNLKKH